jgi:hypothetical protein
MAKVNYVIRRSNDSFSTEAEVAAWTQMLAE